MKNANYYIFPDLKNHFLLFSFNKILKQTAPTLMARRSFINNLFPQQQAIWSTLPTIRGCELKEKMV